MSNAELFKEIFGFYATEIWSMEEKDFLNWLNSSIEPNLIDKKAAANIVQNYIHEIITESGSDKNSHTNGILRNIIKEINETRVLSQKELEEKYEDIEAEKEPEL